jgi:serine/threonine protein kinase
VTTSATRLCPQCGASFGDDVRFCPSDGSSLRATSGELVGQVVAERYLVRRLLGEGGMGRVYLAEHVKMGRKSALKVMSAAMMHDADAIGRFNREASNASRISHPNVAAIYDFGETADGLIYLAMEFVDGESLTALLEREGALAPERAADIARQIADALDAAHELGIVHRDLKPDNIMITRGRDGGDVVKVVDFGIAKAPGASTQAVTRTGLVVGTPEYMSPEQISGDALDARSDIYALGLVTFAMLTGALPFQSRSLQEAMLARLTEQPRTLEEARPDRSWPAPLQRAIDRALARDRNHRYGRASEFAAALKAGLSAVVAEGAIIAAPTQRVTAPVPRTRERRESRPRSGDGTKSSSPLRVGGVMIAGVALVTVVTLLAQQVAPRRGNSGATGPVLGARDSIALASIARSTDSTVPRLVTIAPPEPSKRVEPTVTDARTDERDSAIGTRDSALETRTVRLSGAPAPDGRVPNPDGRVPRRSRIGPPLTPRQARRALDQAQSLIDKGESQRALFLLQGALARMPTRSDSVRAIYHVAEAMLKQGETRRGCDMLYGISSDPSGGYARSASSLYDSQCQ